MASQQDIRRDEVRMRILRYLAVTPHATTRELADEVGVSNGAAYYVLKALLEKGLVKAENFSKSNNKSQYLYLLTRKGIQEKLLLTEKFLKIKRQEYKHLRAEIEELSADLDVDAKVTTKM